MATSKQFTLVSMLALVLGCHAQQASMCGREGQDPCNDGGCDAKYLPSAEHNNTAAWIPFSDNYVVAPAKYRQTEGKCTRCGNIYEPVCIVDRQPHCFIDHHAGIVMEPTEDNICVPPKGLFGCGTTGLPPCPDQFEMYYGTLAVLSRSASSSEFQILASIEQGDDGCIYSEHNSALRFVKAAEEWLPTRHKCANVCIACGVPGYPPCPVVPGPSCMRRTSEQDHSKYRDGPTYVDQNGICRALHCGSSTIYEDLPPCTDDIDVEVLNLKEDYSTALPGYNTSMDADGDGCVEPYVLAGGMCTEGGQASVTVPAIELREDNCAREGMMLIDDNVVASIHQLINTLEQGSEMEEHLMPIVKNKGKCVVCGGNMELPCKGVGFDGCNLQQGYMLDKDIGICMRAPCGAGFVEGSSSPPWNSSACTAVTPEFSKDSPANGINNCLTFHNLIINEDGSEQCQPCGVPGSQCTHECIVGISLLPFWDSEDGIGEFSFLDDSIRTGGRLKAHCLPFPELSVYDDTCSEHIRLGDAGNSEELPIVPMPSPSPSSINSSDAEGPSSAANLDRCGPDDDESAASLNGTEQQQRGCVDVAEEVSSAVTVWCPLTFVLVAVTQFFV